jgi:hypothetical protein
MGTIRIHTLGALVAVGGAAMAVLGSTGASAQYSPTFLVNGAVGTPTVFDSMSLSALPATNLTSAGYTGTSLWNVLQASGGVNPIPGVKKNSILLNYVLSVGSDGYEVAFSGGEISPNFGGGDTNAPYVAYAAYPGGAPLTTTGMARIITQGDNKHGRWNSNLVQLYVGTAPVPAVGPGGISSSFTVSGVQTPTAYSFSTLKALAQSNSQETTVTATYMQGPNSVTDTYTGITLWNLLNDDGLILDPTIKNDVLRQYAEVVGTDGYAAIFSLGEIDPDFGGDNDIVAYGDTSGQLGPGGADGFARMVVPGDTFGGRYVSNIARIEVFTATVPEPSTWVLLVTSFVGLGALSAYRRGSRLA